MQGTVLGAGFPNMEGHDPIDLRKPGLGTSRNCYRLLSVGKQLQMVMSFLVV